jgi:RimJ/RimL family protein N-acetyltransferase
MRMGEKVLRTYTRVRLEALPITRIQCNMVSENITSEKIAQNCGFAFEGIMRSNIFVKRQLHDLKLCSVPRSEFHAIK